MRGMRWGAVVGTIALSAAAAGLAGCGRCKSFPMPSDEQYVEGCGCVANPDLDKVHYFGGCRGYSSPSTTPTQEPSPLEDASREGDASADAHEDDASDGGDASDDGS